MALINEAEQRLIRAGFGGIEDRIDILTGIYYGTLWSLDFQAEHSPVRNSLFHVYTGRMPTSSDVDPRPILGCGLFLSLQRSQDVAGVDMGHVLIGLSARLRTVSLNTNLPIQGATGLQSSTWVGDLGGATARLALDRVREPGTPASRYFQGTDYGAASNLEGDIGAYVVAAASSASVSAPVIPSGSVAAALLSYFEGSSYTNRYRRFLEMQGGVFSGDALTNRASVERAIASNLESFGRLYMVNFVREHSNRFNMLQVLAAQANLSTAAADVARHFVDWLLDQMRGGTVSQPPRRRDNHR